MDRELDSYSIYEPLGTRERPTSQLKDGSPSRLAFVCLCVCVVTVNSTFSVLAPLFPELAEEKGVGLAWVGIIFSAYSFVNVFAAPALGYALQQGLMTRSQLMLGGIVVVGIATCTFASLTHISRPAAFISVSLLLRLAMGLGCVAVDTAAMAATAVQYGGTAYLGTAIGIVESCYSIGWLIGPVLGAFLATSYGFAAPFLATGLASLLLGGLQHLIAARYAGGSADSSQQDSGSPSDEVSGGQVSAWQLLRRPAVAVLLAVEMLSTAAFTSMMPTLSPHLRHGTAFSTRQVGLAFGAMSAIDILGSPLVGWLSDRLGRRQVICAGLGLFGLGFCALGPSPLLPLPAGSGALAFAGLMTMGLASSLIFASMLPALLDAAGVGDGGEDAGGLEDVMTGLLMSMYYLGGGLGPAAGSLLMSHVGFAWSATFFAALALAQAAALAGLGPLRRPAGAGNGGSGFGGELGFGAIEVMDLSAIEVGSGLEKSRSGLLTPRGSWEQ